jgi:hypothetical protein
MTAHPARAAGCSAAEIRVFERIALGDTGGHDAGLLAGLELSGLIRKQRREGSDNIGRYHWFEPVLTPRARAGYDDYLATPRSA